MTDLKAGHFNQMNQTATETIDATYSEASIGRKDYSINGCAPLNAQELIESNDNAGNRDHLFQKGNKLGGRPKGSRSKLSEAFLADVNALWLTHGNQALRDMLQDSPTKFCQMVSLVVPKSLELDNTDGINWVINASPRLTEDEWRQQHNLIESDS